MMLNLILAAVVAMPTIDAIEPPLAARDAANDRAWTELKDPAAFAAKRDAFRETFRRKIGFHDIVRSPLNARSVGAKAYDGFRIEKVILEGEPGGYIAALVFLPDEAKFKPPYPSIKDYLKAADEFFLDREAVTYDKDGHGSVRYW